MDLFIAWKTTWDGEDPRFDVINEDTESLRRKNRAMEAARRIWESWLLRVGGSSIDFNGPDGHATVPADELADLERIRTQIAATLGTGVRLACGVGIKLSEADQALKQAKKQGNDRVVLFTPQDDEDEIPGSPALIKADPPKNPPAAGGFLGATQPQQAAAAAKPKAEGSEHSEAESELSLLDNAPPRAELTHSGADAQAAFEEHADKADEEEKSQNDELGKASADSELKKEVVKVLQHVKAQAPALQQLTASEPKLFAAIQESIHAMLMLAKRLIGGGDQAPVQKSEVAIHLSESNKDPVLKSDRFFVSSAFLSKSGKVVITGSWHDIDQLPEGFEIAQEGFVDGQGIFYDRETATEMSTPIQKSETEEPLKKTEFRSKDGVVIPASYTTARRDYDKKHVEAIIQNPSWAHMDFKPRMVKLSDLATRTSGNMAVNKSRYNLYRRMLAANDRLPPIVIRKNGLKFDIVDGSHRIQAIIDHNGNNVNEPAKIPEIHAIEMFSKTSNKPTPMVPPRKTQEPIKKKLPLPENAPTHTAITYPVGAVKDSGPQGTRDVGRIKVKSPETGKTKWRQVRSGLVMGPDGQPVSSRNPSGK